jgi:Mn2+/Fe2+ NRAMP family transporter
LVAAIGIGAGDLTSAGFAGGQLGTAILWAVILGAFFKFVLNEGLTRWQLVTGQTLLEGMARRLGKWSGWIFLPYFLLWSFFVCANLMGGTGVTLHAIFPIFDDASDGKIVFGILASIAGLILVRRGGFKLFEKVMGVCVLLMFITVVVSAVLLAPDLSEVFKGLLIPSIPDAKEGGIAWTLALIGGIGGTVTILSYGYWIAEEKRHGTGQLRLCRWDLGAAYLVIVIFGIAMVIIGSTVEASGTGAGLIVEIADSLERSLGKVGRWAFLLGAFGATFSSILGVWQSAPYLFADVWRLFVKTEDKHSKLSDGVLIDTKSKPYSIYMYLIATIPILGLFFDFREVQKAYGIVGAAFLPLLTVVLLVLNGRKKWVGKHTNHPITVVVLLSILVFFGYMAWSRWMT